VGAHAVAVAVDLQDGSGSRMVMPGVLPDSVF